MSLSGSRVPLSGHADIHLSYRQEETRAATARPRATTLTVFERSLPAEVGLRSPTGPAPGSAPKAATCVTLRTRPLVRTPVFPSPRPSLSHRCLMRPSSFESEQRWVRTRLGELYPKGVNDRDSGSATRCTSDVLESSRPDSTDPERPGSPTIAVTETSHRRSPLMRTDPGPIRR